MTKYVRPQTGSRREAASLWGVTDLRRRPALSTPQVGGSGIYAIEVFENTTPCVAGDGAFEWEIPEDLDGAVLTKVEAYITTASSSGSVQVQVRNETTGNDLLSTKATIDVGDLNTKDSATPPVVDAAHQTVSWGDHLNIDVDAIGTGTTGLGIVLYFTPATTLSLAVQGAKGDPGGVTSWTGAWSSSTTYTTGQAVSNNGTSYVAIAGSTAVQPGVTAGWQTYWMVLSQGGPTTALSVQIWNQGRILDAGLKAIVYVPFAGTIKSSTLLADQVGNAVFDLRKDTYAAYPPTSGDTIVGSSPPTLSSVAKSTDSSLVGWTTAVAAGDTIWVWLTSVATIRMVTLTLEIGRT